MLGFAEFDGPQVGRSPRRRWPEGTEGSEASGLPCRGCRTPRGQIAAAASVCQGVELVVGGNIQLLVMLPSSSSYVNLPV